MKRLTFTVLSVVLFVAFSACQSEMPGEQQNTVNNSSTVNSNTNNTGEKSMLLSKSTPNSLSRENAPPQIFNISEAEVERAFAEGEALYQELRRRGGSPPVFGKENKVDFRLPTRATLALSVVFKTPRDEAKERGYNFAQRGSSSERVEILNRTKQIIAQRIKQVIFQVYVKKWSNPEFGDDNTPLVEFSMKDLADNFISPTNKPQLDFCVGRDIISCGAGTAIVFPLYRNEQPLLTNTMEFVTLAISIDETTAQETTFRLR